MKKSPGDKRIYYPLTHAQKRIYYDEKIHPGTSVSTQAFIVRYGEILDKKLLEQAINNVILKNDGFRLRIVEFEFAAEPSQYISEYRKISLSSFDFSGADCENRLRRWIEITTKKPIPLIDSDLFYFVYLQFNEEESGYYMKFHHIASDGWSYPLIFSEINSIYEDLKAGDPIDDNPNPSYVQFIEDEQEYLKSRQAEEDKRFWHKTMLPLPEPLNFTQIKGDHGDIKGNAFIVTFPDHLVPMMAQYCKINRTSLFKLLFSALSIYSTRVSGLDDVVIAAVNHNRAEGNREEIIGMFVSTVPFRIKVDADITFKHFLDKVGNDVINYVLKKYQRYPFDRLAAEIMEVTGTDAGYLLDILIAGHGDVEKENYTFEHIFQGYTPTAINLHINYNNKYNDGILELEYEYQVERFSEWNISRIHQGVVNVLNDTLNNPGKKISDISFISEEEKGQILNEFNNTKTEYSNDKTIPELFEAQVEKTPDNIAIVFKNKRLTYRRLNERTNQLAFVLKEKGVGPDKIVAVIVERSLEMMIGIFAIQKAGGAYLPIEPHYPQKRVNYLLNDSEAKLLLTLGIFIETVEDINFEGEIINLEDESLYSSEIENPDLVNISKNMAYIIYTSGSTGLPKGVIIEHQGVMNRINWMHNFYPIGYQDVILQKTTYVFDVSVWELFWWSFVGSAQYLLIPGGEKDPSAIIEAIEYNNITTMHFVPSMLNIFLGYLEGSEALMKKTCLKYVFASGEALTPYQVEKFNELVHKRTNALLINLYGPTEATVDVSYYDCPTEGKPKKVPIGKPVDNTKLLVVDEKNALQPIGLSGELCITGDQLARGYLNRPRLTFEKFIDNPFEAKEGWGPMYKKLYRTGDLTQWLPDGNIEYIGRIDFQVKVRGFRIETGEIENKILTQKDQKINEAVVTARDDSSGEKYLCAYIVSDEEIDVSALNNTLLKDLPEYMIPSYFVQVTQIPLSQSGKVNRKALPDPKIKVKGESYVAPRNEIEEKLVEIWAKILPVDKNVIGIDDNFFKVGGHSLKAAVMISMIHKALKVKILMHEIFGMFTIRKLAAYINEAKVEEYSAVELAEKKEYYTQTSAQKRLYFMDQLQKNSILYNLQLMDVYCKGIEKQALVGAFRKLIRRHESLRTSFHTIEGKAVQIIHDYEDIGLDFEIEYWETAADGLIYSEEPGKEWTMVTGIPFHDVSEHFVKPFDLTRLPLLRVGLIKIYGNTKILLLDMHHIISDGISLVLLIKELWALYDNEILPGLTVQYKDFAEWNNREQRMEQIKKLETFWLDEFVDEIPILNLPYDNPRPPTMTFEGDMLHFEISEKETKRFNRLAQEEGKTLYMLLLAVFYVMLAKLTGQEDIVVGTVSAGRDHADLQNIIGMFVDTLAMRNYPEEKKSFKEFLGEIKERTLAAFDNQDYPFEQLVSKVSPRKDSSRNPLFDVVFTLDNEAERTQEYLHDVLLLDKSNPYSIKRSKFDMTLMGAEKEDGLQFNLEYNTQLFKQETIERFITYFKKIVFSITRNINQNISQIEIIPESEKAIILYGFNDTEALYPKDKTIHQLYEEQVEKNPDNIAVVGASFVTSLDNESLTYIQLNTKANKIARVLRDRGMRTDEIAAIMVEPSLEMIIGLMGILKAGGAFLPIDHKIPTDRIKYILEESGTRLLLTREELMEKIVFTEEIIELNDERIYSGEEVKLPQINSPSDLAYIIYTSGSTGKPKGVMVEHRSLANLCFWHNKYYSITSNDHATKFAGFGFDASVWEVFPYLVIGASIYIVPEEIKLDIQKLNRFFEDNGITISFLPTQLCEQFMTIENTSLRALLTGGDKLKIYVKKNYLLYNNYGPTENTVVTTSFPVNEFSSNIPIGKPLSNNQIYILDKNDHLQPLGVPGELCIGGDSLARGYLNNPKMTFERFTVNPYPPPSILQINSYILYRTGDLVRWLSDGDIEFLGRIDYQVKIRGFRIELGEIENQLLHINHIKEAVVIAREDTPGHKYLCAYFLSSKEMDIPSIKKTLSLNLPEYMIPSFLIQIEKMPLNPSGKIDTKALPAPEVKGVEYAAPTDEAEKMLADIWSEVLGMEKVGIDDNFFEIGGDSIKTVLISGRLQKRQFKVNVNKFFLNPTIRQLARHLKEKEAVDKNEVVSWDEEKIQKNINRDYEMYLEQVRKEEWPDLTFENDYKNILLTGATGYLGSYLLYELLDKTSAALYLPVRGASPEEVEERLKKKLAFYFGIDFFYKHKPRMFVFQSDLRNNKMELDDAHYEELCNTVDSVVHSAANVKHYGLYEEFYKDNVEGTGRLLEFALTGKKKDFHFISTIDTGRGEIPGKEHLLFTEYCHDEGQNSNHLYIKSKFEAEKKVLAYREKGVNASIYRAGNITFHSETGQFQENIENNAFYTIMRGIIKVGFLSDNMMKLMFDMSFINYSALAIVLLLTRAILTNETYHISNPNQLSMKNMIEFLKASGIQIPDVKAGNICEHLAQFEGDQEYEKIIERMKLDSWAWEEKPATLTVAKADRTVMLLNKTGFEWPKVKKEHIEKMIAHCKNVGFL